MQIDTLHSGCVKYDRRTNTETSMGLALAAAMPSRIHIHFSIVDLLDVVAVVQLSSGDGGCWFLDSSLPRLSSQTAIAAFDEVKRLRLSERKHLAVVKFNSCSPLKVVHSLEHFRYNQHGEFYNPRLHGWPQI